jgi:hypothetical protein
MKIKLRVFLRNNNYEGVHARCQIANKLDGLYKLEGQLALSNLINLKVSLKFLLCFQ